MKEKKDVLNIKRLLENFYTYDETYHHNRENNENTNLHNISRINDLNTSVDHRKLEQLESELKKTRSKFDKINSNYDCVNKLKMELKTKRDMLNRTIKEENDKIDKIKSIRLSNLNQYDKVKLMTATSNMDVNIEKYISSDNEYKNSNNDSKNNKENLLLEMEKLKLKYEDKSVKFENIIRKLKSKLGKDNI